MHEEADVLQMDSFSACLFVRLMMIRDKDSDSAEKASQKAGKESGGRDRASGGSFLGSAFRSTDSLTCRIIGLGRRKEKSARQSKHCFIIILR